MANIVDVTVRVKDAAASGLRKVEDEFRASGGASGKGFSSEFTKQANAVADFGKKAPWLAVMAPALTTAATGIAGALVPVAASLGAATVGAGLFGAMAKTVFSKASSDATSLSTLQAKLATDTTAKQKQETQKQIGTLESGWSSAYSSLVTNTVGVERQWQSMSTKIATPVLANWLGAAAEGIKFLQPLVTPVAAVFGTWGKSLEAYFSPSSGHSAEITKIVSAFGNFSAGQLRDDGTFIVDIGKGVSNLARDLAGHNVDFGTFGQHLASWGAGFLTWSKSSGARTDVTKLLTFLTNNAGALKTVTADLAKYLPAILSGASASGASEFGALGTLLGIISKVLTPGEVATFAKFAGWYLLLSKTGVLSLGIKVVGMGASLISKLFGSTTATINAASMQTAADTMVTAAGLMQKAADTMVGADALGGAAGDAGAAEGVAAGAAGAGEGAAVAGAGAVAGGSALLGGAAVAAPFLLAAAVPLAEHFDSNQFVNATKQVNDAQKALDAYTKSISANGTATADAASTREGLVNSLKQAGVSSGTAQNDVNGYTRAVAVNGATSQAAAGAREKLISDLVDASTGSRSGERDVSAFTSAVAANGAKSQAAQGARARLISDLTHAGLSSSAAAGLVNGLQGSINGLHGKSVTVNANVRQALNAIATVQGGLANTNSKSISLYVKTYNETFGSNAAANSVFGSNGNLTYAGGGAVSTAAGGGARGGMVLVGEHGREMVRLPAGSTVRSNSDTESALAGGGGGLHITLELGDSFKRAGLTASQLEDIRYTVRTVGGGSPAKAFGKAGVAS